MPRDYLKANLVPVLRDLGFRGSFPHFRRHRGNRNELLTIQFDKYNKGKFVIELGVVPFGEFTTYFGKAIAPSKLTAHDLADRLRLGAESESGDHWFDVKAKPVDQIALLLETKADAYYREHLVDE